MTKIMNVLLGVAGLALAISAQAAKVTVKYSDLLGIQENIGIEDVQVVGVVPQSDHPFIGGAYAIKLHIKGYSACGEKFFTDMRDGMLRFYQVGDLGGHIQPACEEVIEYLWEPSNYDIKKDESAPVSLKVGADDQADVWTISATLTQKIGTFPTNPTTSGYYFEYTDTKVEKK